MISPIKSPIPLEKLPAILGKVVSSEFGRSSLAFIASPPFGNLEAEFDASVKKELDGSKEENNKFKKFFSSLKNGFAWGDIFSIAGITLWAISSKYLKTKEGEQPSPTLSWLNLAAKVLTLGGTPLARFGQMMDLHRQKALGSDKYGDAYVNLAEKTTGKKVFEEISVEDLKKKAQTLKKLLSYNRNIERNVLYRHDAQDGITGLFYGEPGTGKTTGAELVLGNWASKQQSLGYDPVIKKLNVAVLDEYQEKNRKKLSENVELLKELNEGTAKLLSQSLDDPLVALEMLIRKANAAVDEVDSYNQSIKDDSSKKERRLSLFIDEFDKVVDWTLKGADKGKLTRLITEFNELCDKSNLIMTSNKKIEEFVEAFRQLGLSEGEIVKPFADRLQRNPVYITIPEPDTQARIIANNLLLRTSSNNLLEIDDNGTLINLNAFSTEREKSLKLQEIIYKHISRHPGSNNINGRHIEVAMSSKLESELSGAATEIREDSTNTLGCTDEEWERLNAYEKAEKANVKITIPMIKNLMIVQQHNYLGESDRNLTTGTFSHDTAISAFQHHLNSNLDSILEKIKTLRADVKDLTPEKIFTLFEDIYTRNSTRNTDVYSLKTENIDETKLYEYDGTKYIHGIRVTKFTDSSGKQTQEPIVEIGYFDYNNGVVNSDKPFTVRYSQPYKLSEFVTMIQGDLADAFEKKYGSTGLFNQFFRLLSGGLGGDTGQFFEMFINEIEKRKG